MTELFVQKIAPNGEMAEVFDHDLLNENTKKLKPFFEISESSSPLVFYAGRFICTLVILEGQTIQRFFDFKKNRSAAEYGSIHYDIVNPELFMEMFDKQFKIYDQIYDQVLLVVIQDPLEGISAN